MAGICFLLTAVSADSNPRPGEKITVHVVTHSHLDAGWIFDVNTCYTTVKSIFNSVLESMISNEERKYTVGDIYFFRRWYEELDVDKQTIIKRYVQEQRWEIVHGGAVSTDEATVSFHDMIDNMIISRHWLQKEFGIIPNIGW